jgi:pantoate kinase
MTSEAFCPGHITSLFYPPEPGPTPETTGSRGAGTCISLGARASVRVENVKATAIVPVGDTFLNPVVLMALGDYLHLAPDPVQVHLGLDLDLPVGQGFGMSGAMTFAALVALEGELGLVDGDDDALLALAHSAEVAFSTGLGDVVAQAKGGIDVRVREGLPPSGEVRVVKQEASLLVAWGSEPLHTRSVLEDPGARTRLEQACLPHMEPLKGTPDLEWLLEAGWAFAREAGLVSEAVKLMTTICSAHGRASQVMLGNSVFAAGDLDAMAEDLGSEGFSYRVTCIDNEGVRLLS